MKKKIKLAMIGCGKIASSHVEALSRIGLNISHCASRYNSSRVSDFAKKHKIPYIWKDPIKLAKSSENWDGIILCSSTNSVPKLLDILIKQKKPIMVEKPVSIGLNYLKKFKNKNPDFVIVAFNRRYYRTSLKARKFIEKSNGQILCNLKLPERIKKNSNKLKKFFNIFDNSVHGIDLLRFLFGDLEIISNTKVKLNNFDSGRVVLLKSEKNHLCNITISPNSPDNFSLEIENGTERFLMKPFENYEIFDGLKVIKPNKKYPLRVYKPSIIEKGNVFGKEIKNIDLKPGFYGQANDFYELLKGNNNVSAKLYDAYKAQELLVKIM